MVVLIGVCSIMWACPPGISGSSSSLRVQVLLHLRTDDLARWTVFGRAHRDAHLIDDLLAVACWTMSIFLRRSFCELIVA